MGDVIDFGSNKQPDETEFTYYTEVARCWRCGSVSWRVLLSRNDEDAQEVGGFECASCGRMVTWGGGE